MWGLREIVIPYLVEKQPMLQFNYSQATNTNAVYPDVTASVGTTQVLLDFTQSINKNTFLGVITTLANSPTVLNPWLVLQLTGSSVPPPSGQYDVNIWQYTQTYLQTWSTQATIWDQTDFTWDGSQGGIQRDVLLSTERAFVSGSNEYPITQYLLPTNAGYYYTYNHP